MKKVIFYIVACLLAFNAISCEKDDSLNKLYKEEALRSERLKEIQDSINNIRRQEELEKFQQQQKHCKEIEDSLKTDLINFNINHNKAEVLDSAIKISCEKYIQKHCKYYSEHYKKYLLPFKLNNINNIYQYINNDSTSINLNSDLYKDEYFKIIQDTILDFITNSNSSVEIDKYNIVKYNTTINAFIYNNYHINGKIDTAYQYNEQMLKELAVDYYENIAIEDSIFECFSKCIIYHLYEGDPESWFCGIYYGTPKCYPNCVIGTRYIRNYTVGTKYLYEGDKRAGFYANDIMITKDYNNFVKNIIAYNSLYSIYHENFFEYRNVTTYGIKIDRLPKPKMEKIEIGPAARLIISQTKFQRLDGYFNFSYKHNQMLLSYTFKFYEEEKLKNIIDNNTFYLEK